MKTNYLWIAFSLLMAVMLGACAAVAAAPLAPTTATPAPAGGTATMNQGA